jgi:hypothetical protein
VVGKFTGDRRRFYNKFVNYGCQYSSGNWMKEIIKDYICKLELRNRN